MTGGAPERVGTDVVDLTNPRTLGKSGDARFMERIFTQPERALVADASDSDVEVWRLWAAKESAYKVVSKFVATPPPFDHSAFEVAWSVRGGLDSAARGSVSFEGHRVTVRVDTSTEWVRGLGWISEHKDEAPGTLIPHVARLDAEDAPWAHERAALEALLTPRELEAVHSHASAAVRVAAKTSLAEVLGVPLTRVEIVCPSGALGRRPPFAMVDGEAAPLDVSLSHDGPWIAWAIRT